ncbi:MAG: S66 peptidase family protein [Candidatus Omnitrophota bacterium]
MEKPKPLHSGDKVGIFVPSSPVKEPFRSEGLKEIASLGYVPVEVDDIGSRDASEFLAREPETGLADIQYFFDTREIRALWAARGGYGSNQLLPLLGRLRVSDFKPVIGSSDVSYLLWYLMDRFGMVVFYGPMAYSSLPGNRFNRENLTRVLRGDYETLTLPGRVLIPGNEDGCVTGMVTGGCLSNLVSLIGTPYFPQVAHRLLLLEDIGERPYRLDRMLWQLANSGIFEKIDGLLLGQFPHCFKDSNEKENFLKRVLVYLDGHRVPVIYDLPVGHSDRIHTLPLGINMRIFLDSK